ncbi:MAG: methyltransferase domain-containing protein, partial [Pseudonocardia sp.]
MSTLADRADAAELADRAAALAAHLQGLDGVDPGWAAVFARVPRHVFVPAFYPTLDTDGDRPPRLLNRTDPEHHQEWLDTVYTDRSLVTQCALTPGTTQLWQSTSSSTRPSLMARMLTLLDLPTNGDGTDGGRQASDAGGGEVRVLEIGTGTGYNAALLCERLGDAAVTSVDLDPGLVATAAHRLATLGHHPVLVAADGADGLPDRGPYHRILATCAVPALPPAWIEQLHPGGLVVADIRGGLASHLLVARRDGGQLVGRFLAEPGHFMWMRRDITNPLRDGGTFSTHIDYDDAHTRPSSIDPALLDHPDARFFLQLAAPEVDRIWTSRRDGTPIIRITATTGDWVELD